MNLLDYFSIYYLKAIIISTFIIPSGEIHLKGIEYPSYAKAIGWVIVAIPLIPIPVCALYQAKKHNFDWVRIYFIL